MSMRIFSLCALTTVLAACGGGGTSGEPEGSLVECAIGPGSEFSDVCTIELISAEEFVIHHPDGGFRRFTQSDDSSSPIAVADGAEPLTYQRVEGESGVLELGLSVDRYRIESKLIASTPDE